MLRQDRSHEQTAIRPAQKGELRVVRVMTSDQVVCCGRKIVEAILLLRQHAFLVPALAILGPAPDIGDGVDTSGIEPQSPHGAKKARRLTDAVSAIAVEQRRILA